MLNKAKKVILYAAAAFALFNGGGMLAKSRAAVMADAPSNSGRCMLAVVIDDFGYHGEGTEEMLALDIPLTAAVMPFSESSAEDAAAAAAAGKEVIVHMPMESLTGKRSWVGDKGVFRDMNDEAIAQRVREAVSVVSGAAGLNNHMGSAIMEDKRSLSVVIDVLKEDGMYFLDSMTTEKSVSAEVCGEKGVKLLKRDVFLDSTDDIAVVRKNIEKAAEIAISKGKAIAIGHVGPEGGMVTVNALKELAPELKERGIEFVTLSEMAKE